MVHAKKRFMPDKPNFEKPFAPRAEAESYSHPNSVLVKISNNMLYYAYYFVPAIIIF